jgi:ABC-type uncharacterized transport system ATPase subunit
LSPAVSMRNISKTFHGGERPVAANNQVDLTVEKGEIHAIVGENGAGKTTLMNILYGLVKPDEGEIEIDGRRVDITGPKIAIQNGIGMVHQHFMLVPSLTIAENIVLGMEPSRAGVVDTKAAQAAVVKLASTYGLKVDPNWRVRDCSVGIQQRTEILKVLYRGARLLILDEPTAVLTPQEIHELFAAMRHLTEQGTTILFITHKLREVLEVSNNVTVMRDGRVVGRLPTAEASENQLARLMVGRELLMDVHARPRGNGTVVLDVQNLMVEDDLGLPAVRGVSFQVRSGEIVGVAGVARNGQEILAEALMGQRPVASGKVYLSGQDITGWETRRIREGGCGHVPDDRYGEGCAKQASIINNLLMGWHYRPPLAGSFWINQAKADAFAKQLIEQYDVRTSDPSLPIISLSGGNVQKAIVAREMSLAKNLMIAEQPSRGIDVGATEYIYQQIGQLRDKGAGVLLFSNELSEVLQLSTRILVMYEGRIVGERRPDETSEEDLGLLMAGITRPAPVSTPE